MNETFDVRLAIGPNTDRYRTFQWEGSEADLRSVARTWTEHGCLLPHARVFIPARWISSVSWAEVR